jgi:porin
VQSVLGLNTGGSFRNHDSIRYPYGGHAEYRLNVDTGKLGLWPGGFPSVMGESQLGSYLKGKETGALLPPDAAALYPTPFDEETTLTSVVFTQFLAKWFGIYLGKIETFSGDANAFAHEWKTQFMNTGFGPNPILFQTIPYSTLGAGFLSGDEVGLEIFYNIAATNWLSVTPDIQVIEPAGKRATTAGLRLQMGF